MIATANQIVDELEREMQIALTQGTEGTYPVELPLVHHFAEGLYAREIRIPKDTLITGKVHRFSHVNIISQGRIWVWVEGMEFRLFHAPCTFTAAAGTRKVAYTLEDTVWTTIHASKETDIEKLEAELSVPANLLETKS